MKTKLWVLAAISLLFSLSLSASTSYQWPITITANPMGAWSLNSAVNSDWLVMSDLTPMLLITGTTDRWRYSNDFAPWQPSYNYYGDNYLRTCSWPGGDEMRRPAVVIFQAPQTGYYSIQIDWRSYGTGSAYTLEYLNIRTLPDASTPGTILWSTLRYFSTGSWEVFSDNLSTVPELQNIFLSAGSYIAFTQYVVDNPGNYPMSDTKFFAPDSGMVGGRIVFDPTTPPVTVQGAVTLSDYVGDGDPHMAVPIAVRVEFRQGNTVIRTEAKILDTNNVFTIDNIPSGNYDVAVKTYAHLQKVLNVTLSPTSTNLGTFDLVGGDANGDNGISSTDLAIVLAGIDIVGNP